MIAKTSGSSGGRKADSGHGSEVRGLHDGEYEHRYGFGVSHTKILAVHAKFRGFFKYFLAILLIFGAMQLKWKINKEKEKRGPGETAIS